jgi:hypothetical protein
VAVTHRRPVAPAPTPNIELATTLSGRLTVRRLDVDRDPEISIRYGVLGMPTLILFAGGQPVDRLVGFRAPDTCANGSQMRCGQPPRADGPQAARECA